VQLVNQKWQVLTTVCLTGGILPTGFLKDIGITVETKYGTA
jgi:hypothetical protein